MAQGMAKKDAMGMAPGPKSGGMPKMAKSKGKAKVKIALKMKGKAKAKKKV